VVAKPGGGGAQSVLFPTPGTLDIAAINGVPIAGHQGASTITDVTIRTLLTVKQANAPSRIVSLMAYPGAPSTVAAGDHSTFVQLEVPTVKPPRAAATNQAVSGAAGATSASAVGASASAGATHTGAPGALSLDTSEWQRLIDQIGSIQQPTIPSAQSASAIRDATPPAGSGGSTTRELP
jgi:hypothetical protein